MTRDLRRLFVEELKAVLDVEEQIVKEMSKLAKASLSAELKKALAHHVRESRAQVTRLKHIFRYLKLKAAKKQCQSVRSLLKECREIVKHYPKSAFRDAALITKMQHIKHIEMSTYGTLCAFAKELDFPKIIPNMLHHTYDEERHLDKLLTKLAKGSEFKPGINHEANRWAGHHKIAVSF